MTDRIDSEWKALATDAELRLRAVREYAADVLGSDDLAARWLGRTHLAVRRGACPIAEACRTPDGFFEAMAELARISRFSEREGRKRAQMMQVMQPRSPAPDRQRAA
jgi:hypothetical protein